MFSDAIAAFKDSVIPEKTRVTSLPPLIFIFGGPAPVENKYASCRNVFLTWAYESKFELSPSLKIPEDYNEWNQFEGYDNLVDFERDAGCLSRGILLFSESAGALAELGAFCMDEVLCERLLVVVENSHYGDDSFIRLGPIKRIEEIHGSDAICVVESTRDTAKFESRVTDVGAVLKTKVENVRKTQRFDPRRTRDQFLLIVDLVELFGAIGKKELEDLLLFMGVPALEPRHLKRMLNLLVMLELVVRTEDLTARFFTPPVDRSHFLDYSGHGEKRFERSPFKLKVASPELKGERARLRAYEKIHGVQK